MALSSSKILKFAGIVDKREIHVPKWADDDGDDVVIVRGMTIREFEIHQARLERAKDDEKAVGLASSRLIARCAVDENGARIFKDDDATQIAELGLAEVLKLTNAINELSGFGDEAAKDLKGESEAAQTSNSPSE